jgi:transposase
LHTRQQTIAMLDDQTGELVEKELDHEGDQVREFYSTLPRPVLVGLEATGSMHWFLRLLEELAVDYRVGIPPRSGLPNPANKNTTAAMRA